MPWTDNSPAWTNIESPFKGFQEGLQTGVSLGSIAIQRQASELKLKQQAQQLAESSLAMTAQEQTMQYNLETHRRALDIQTDQMAGQSEFAAALADISNLRDWNEPGARAQIFDVATRHPSIVGSPAWLNAMDNFQKSDKAEAEKTKWQTQAELAKQRQDVAEARLGLAQDKAAGGLKETQLLNEIDSEDELARKAQQSGDTASYQRHKQRSDLLKEAMPGTYQESVTTGYDDQGRPIVTMAKGSKGIGSPSGATVGTASVAQQKLVKYENATQLLSTIDKNLTAKDVGVAGVGGEFVLDRTLAQIPGMEGFANKGRIATRTALGVARESLLREISDDARFSNKDREDIGKMLPSTGLFESYTDAKQRIETVKQIIADRSRNYAERIGEPVPMFAQTADELKGNFQRRKGALLKAVSAGNLTQEDADKQIADIEQKTLDALVKFH